MSEVVAVKNLTKECGKQKILDNLSFNISKGEIVGIVGPSGSGKSTLLRCLQGIEKITSGEINSKYKVGMIFQNFNLFPHLSVIENITYAPIKVLKIDDNLAKEHARKLLAQFNILNKENAMPKSLSGGQKQRVAIIRALMIQPEILLLDEPTSALDLSSVQDVVDVLKSLQSYTLVIASHELDFLKQIATRIIMINKGIITLDEPAEEFFKHSLDTVKDKFIELSK